MDFLSPEADDKYVQAYLTSVEFRLISGEADQSYCRKKYYSLWYYLQEQIELANIIDHQQSFLRLTRVMNALSINVSDGDLLYRGIQLVTDYWSEIQLSYYNKKEKSDSDFISLCLIRSVVMSMMDKVVDEEDYADVFGKLLYESISYNYDNRLYVDFFKQIAFEIDYLIACGNSMDKVLAILNILHNVHEDNEFKLLWFDYLDEPSETVPVISEDFYVNNFIQHIFVNVAGKYGAEHKDIKDFFDTRSHFAFNMDGYDRVLISKDRLN